MATVEHVAIDVKDITLAQAQGPDLALGTLGGVQVLVVLRHRH
ncbi:MAG: hypothetical protein ACRDPG_14300 [Nocardioidaceae bacterium]